MSMFPGITPTPEGAQPSEAEFVNYVSLGTVGHDPEDSSLAFVRVVDGQVLVEVELAGDGDAVNAYLCHSQTGSDAGDYIPVEPGDAVVLVWPDGQASSPYILARLADVERQLAGACCGLDTSSPTGVRQFRWLRTPAGQIYAVQAGGEMLLEGSSVRITGAQVLVNGATHLGADFTTPPVPGQPLDGTESTPTAPAAPFVPTPDVSLSLDVPPPGPQLANGIVRFSDSIESNILTDPDFWAFILTVNGLLILVAAFLGVPWPYSTPESLPSVLKPRHTTASTTHTANDPPLV
jgi:hypothetical protein